MKTNYSYVNEWGARRYVNAHGVDLNWDTVQHHMDPELKDRINREMTVTGIHEYFETYARLHKEKYNKDWEFTKAEISIN